MFVVKQTKKKLNMTIFFIVLSFLIKLYNILLNITTIINRKKSNFFFGGFMVDKNKKLRRKAEELIQNKSYINSGTNVEDYIHELRVHQMKLELQNEELNKYQMRLLENSQREYFDLYNFAPVGYFTLDKNGIILKVNLSGSALLNIERVKLYNNAFIQYVPVDQRNKFHHHIKNAFETGIKQTLELKLRKKEFNPFYAHLETITVQDENGNFKEFRITITDIQNLKNTEKALKDSEERYRQIFQNNHASMLLKLIQLMGILLMPILQLLIFMDITSIN